MLATCRSRVKRLESKLCKKNQTSIAKKNVASSQEKLSGGGIPSPRCGRGLNHTNYILWASQSFGGGGEWEEFPFLSISDYSENPSLFRLTHAYIITSYIHTYIHCECWVTVGLTFCCHTWRGCMVDSSTHGVDGSTGSIIQFGWVHTG